MQKLIYLLMLSLAIISSSMKCLGGNAPAKYCKRVMYEGVELEVYTVEEFDKQMAIWDVETLARWKEREEAGRKWREQIEEKRRLNKDQMLKEKEQSQQKPLSPNPTERLAH